MEIQVTEAELRDLGYDIDSMSDKEVLELALMLSRALTRIGVPRERREVPRTTADDYFSGSSASV